MKKILLVLTVVACIPGMLRSQHAAKISDYTLGEKELVIFPFGMEQKIVVGKVDADGNMLFDWSNFDASTLKNTEIYLEDFKRILDLNCEEEVVDESSIDGIKAANAGNLYIWNETRWEGALTVASSNELKEHILDHYGKDAAVGKYLNWVYADGDADYKSTCMVKQYYMDVGEIEQTKHFDLHLKKGWNIILFEIKEVVPVKNAAAMAVDIHISTAEDYPENINWYLKKF